MAAVEQAAMDQYEQFDDYLEMVRPCIIAYCTVNCCSRIPNMA